MMEESLRSGLLATVAAFEAATGISAKTVGKRSINDNTFFPRISAGDNFTVKTYDRVIGWMSDNWPHDLTWPESVDRPARIPQPEGASS